MDVNDAWLSQLSLFELTLVSSAFCTITILTHHTVLSSSTPSHVHLNLLSCTTILLPFTGEQDAAIAFCYKTLNGLGMTGRLRIAREVSV